MNHAIFCRATNSKQMRGKGRERGIADDTTVVRSQLQKLIDLIMPKGIICDIEHILKACHHVAV
jgi:hypothetical protein